ncbi:DNA-binding protein [Terrimonas sp. NA20]|uniref:DNA-binding protein n=1 Tax=Terrimonas ginsenosidimutans TaxID=2908004 RepID=A0ABS9KR39_9BACT|nr:glycosyl hydrolase [Terrimonas ginsenosidimutans]MCG2614793.1 DNA-binding protein [Terrimonas ginsenosidimutans]
MKNKWLFILLIAFSVHNSHAQTGADLETLFRKPPESAKPWVLWYWMQAASSKPGITADLEAMKQMGIGGAYMVMIKDTTSPPLMQPAVRQLSPEWWENIHFAQQEAKRLGLKLGMHVSDGFALAGGPWITPELSMQKLVWTKTYIKNGNANAIKLDQPEAVQDYYEDVAVFAYPAIGKQAFADTVLIPTVSTSNGTKPSFLCFESEGKESLRMDSAGWIEYKYPRPFTCRSIRIHTGGNNYQAQRLIVQQSNDGMNFTTVTRLEAPRHGWQDTDEDFTYALPPTTARYFRFVYDKEGTEPGSEDLDAAKWKATFKIMHLLLSDEPVISQYEGKNASIWRLSKRTTTAQLPQNTYTPLASVIDLTGKMDKEGNLNWKAPAGDWIIVRIGHTSTGHTNATGGAARGLECDKFNPAAIKLQFDNWFGKAFNNDPALAKEVLKIFYIDSWECGSQNWSRNFAAEFKKRRGYDLKPYLLTMTGVPLQDSATSENFLHDLRQTVADLVTDVFYPTLKDLAKEKGCSFTAESVAPTMMSDGLLHYQHTDLPMGEFWLNSPTHDKPNDMLDAINGGRIYGKNIISAEAFTSVRMNWGEHPGNLKAVGDRNFALGINRFVFHVWSHNPWLDRKPGMTLDGVGLYFQRDQTWFKPAKAWVDYITRSQALLQQGKPVVDIAVFIGEEMPRRSLLPDRLVSTLPGIFGKQRVEEEKRRLENKGQPTRSIPDGVTHSANMADPEDWIDPLNGYAYDSFNPDVLLQAKVVNGRVAFPGGASYALLVFPVTHKMQPDAGLMSLAVAKKILELLNAGATIMINQQAYHSPVMNEKNAELNAVVKQIFNKTRKKGKIISSPYTLVDFSSAGIKKDVEVPAMQNVIAWTHRKTSGADVYFIANQKDSAFRTSIFFNIKGYLPEVWDAVTGKINTRALYKDLQGRIQVTLDFAPSQSYFIVFRTKNRVQQHLQQRQPAATSLALQKKWTVSFDTAFGGPAKPVAFADLVSWTTHADSTIKYYSGTAIYRTTFTLEKIMEGASIDLNLSEINNIASVKVNGVDCGVLWTKPYRLSIGQAVKTGENVLEIEVSNTWANRLIRDQQLPKEKRITWTTAPFRLAGKPLLPAGITGEVLLLFYQP